MDTLKPLSQAAWLLQVNKSTDDDANEINEKCTELNPVQVLCNTLYFLTLEFSHLIPTKLILNFQIVKILNSYTPIDDFEKRVSSSFVRKVQVSSVVGIFQFEM